MIAGPHAIPSRLFHADAAPRPAPAVLCQRTVERLAQLNSAVRRLRALGVRVLETQLDGTWPADGEPLVRIERDPDMPFGPFLDEAGPRTWVQLQGGAVSHAAATFHGVTVTWEEQQ